MSASTPLPDALAVNEVTLSQPHIPAMQGEVIEGWIIPFLDIPITNTIFSTWIFMVFITIGAFMIHRSFRSNNLPRLRTATLSVASFLKGYTDSYFIESGKVPDPKVTRLSRQLFPLLSGVFLFVLLANLFSLLLDWLILVSHHHALAHYLRPINSDLNTTLALALITIIISQVIAFRFRGAGAHLGSYFANFHGHGAVEKGVNFFVGILHFIGEFSKILGLSMRLFGNIFAGVVLISVIAFLTTKISLGNIYVGQLLVLPFWLFEVFVACIQAYIFYTLMHVYFQESTQAPH